MKKLFLFLPVGLWVLFAMTGCSDMDSKIESCKAFGQEEFSHAKWISGDSVTRGRMFYRYLKERSPLRNLRVERVREELGANTAYYLYDHFPAYYIGPPPPGGGSPAYLFAFVVDHASGRITDIHLDPSP
jgi:hypothetical protein